MPVYAVGDIQGCLSNLQHLLDRVRFDQAVDRLWLVGDLVNRGPESLATLRFVKSLGEAAISVLGNHDLNLLAVSEGLRAAKRNDTLQPILEAPDRPELLDWLRRRPLLHWDETLGYLLVHAGLPPQWDLATARECAAEAEAMLAGPRYAECLANLFGDTPPIWAAGLSGWPRLRYIVNALTRLRYVDAAGRLNLKEKAPLAYRPAGLMPWFSAPGRRSQATAIVCGHWSTLGLHLADNIVALDTGCVWGGQLTAVRLDSRPLQPLQVNCGGHARPSEHWE